MIKDKLAGTRVMIALESKYKKSLKPKNSNKVKIVTRRGDLIYLECIVAGSLRKKGISIVEINSGAQLVCAIPKEGDNHQKMYDYLISLLNKKKVPTIIYKTLKDFDDTNPFSGIANCSYS